MGTARFVIILGKEASLEEFLKAWLRTDPRCGQVWDGMRFVSPGEEGGLESFVPGQEEECCAKLHWWRLEGTRFRVQFHNHPGQRGRFNTKVFADWFKEYLEQQGVEFSFTTK